MKTRSARVLPPLLLALLMSAVAGPVARAASLEDPFGVLPEPSPPAAGGCDSARGPLTGADIIDLALCRNPRTAAVWARLRNAAADAGTARAAYLPTLSVNGSLSESLDGNGGGSGNSDGGDASGTGGSGDTRTSVSAALGFLLFDFGVRSASLDRARALLEAAQATRSDVLQSVYLDAVTAYYAWVAAEGALDAARESERAARSSLEAAELRESAGTATRADRLQAQTALARSQLLRTQTEGDLRTARGVLANATGLPANSPLNLAPPPRIVPVSDYTEPVDPLVRTSLGARPDLAAATASLRAAEAGLRAARAAGLPSLSASVTERWIHTAGRDSDGATLGLSLSLPLFRGFADTYRVHAAEAQMELGRAELDRLRNAATLDVYRAHSELTTQTQSVFSAEALVSAAAESETVARGRYEAGVGTILDLINAQSAAADARQQLVRASTGLAVSRLRLARAVGAIDIENPR